MSTFIKISTITVGSGGASSIDFTSIPATYTDLKLVVSARADVTDTTIRLTFNGSATSYSGKRLYGNGATASSDASATTYLGFVGMAENPATANTFGSAEIYVPNYASANYKSVSIDGASESNGATQYAMLFAGLWSNTAAINQITMLASTGNFKEFSSATLYGIKSS